MSGVSSMSNDSMTVKQLSDLLIEHRMRIHTEGDTCVLTTYGDVAYDTTRRYFPDLASLGRYVKATYVLTVPINKEVDK